MKGEPQMDPNQTITFDGVDITPQVEAWSLEHEPWKESGHYRKVVDIIVNVNDASWSAFEEGREGQFRIERKELSEPLLDAPMGVRKRRTDVGAMEALQFRARLESTQTFTPDHKPTRATLFDLPRVLMAFGKANPGEQITSADLSDEQVTVLRDRDGNIVIPVLRDQDGNIVGEPTGSWDPDLTVSYAIQPEHVTHGRLVWNPRLGRYGRFAIEPPRRPIEGD